MNPELSSFAARLRGLIQQHRFLAGEQTLDRQFDVLALELFGLQFNYNSAYQKICQARKVTPQTVGHWTQVPFVPTGAFKELELTSIPPAERTAVFHSSGTTEQKPSRHFHNGDSLVLYEVSLWKWFELFLGSDDQFVFLTPPPRQAPHSSLVHMFETIRRKCGQPESAFTGRLAADGAWTIDFAATVQVLKSACETGRRLSLLGTAFSFVHLLDYLGERNLSFQLPRDSSVMETGGYKNRSRALPKAELHQFITERLGVPREQIICEYGMSELCSQAYDEVTSDAWRVTGAGGASRGFSFPPWARAQIISPETGREVADGETGLIRIFDLANVYSVAAIQTEDLGFRWGDWFDLVGRAQPAEPRGCSLMSA